MKKVLLYILLVLILLAAAGWFYYSRNPESNILNFSFGSSQREDKEDQDNPESTEPKFINQGPAPEFAGLKGWLNTEKPLALAELQGRVVLVNFWTYSSINSINTLPYLNKWHNSYKDQGLIVIGIHTPEFTFEKVASNVEAAVKRYSVNYPVAQDNDYKTWRAYQNLFWPATYLIDKNGEIVYTNYGEGSFQQTEKAIRLLLGLEGEFHAPPVTEENKAATPEIYLGLLRLNSFGGSEKPGSAEQIYAFPKRLNKNQFALEGRWRFEPEAAVHTEGYGRIRLNFNASKVFMVAQSREPVTLKIYVDGKLQKGVTVKDSNLYPLYDSATSGAHIMEIEFPKSGAQVFTFTFN